MIDECNSLKMNLKVLKNQWEWICSIQNIEARAREIVCKDIIYT